MTDKPRDMHTEHGMRCPYCGQADSFGIEIPQTCYVSAQGIDDADYDKDKFKDDNPAFCNNEFCDRYLHWRTVGYFRAKVEPRTKRNRRKPDPTPRYPVRRLSKRRKKSGSVSDRATHPATPDEQKKETTT